MNSGGGAVFQSLLHDSLLATAHVESCALFRKKDGSVKAASAGYQVCYGAWHKFSPWGDCWHVGGTPGAS